jgi:hypothetical protein
MYNPCSNFTWNKVKCISIKRYQIRSVPVPHASFNTTLSPKTATDPSGPKVGHLSTKTKLLQHHTVDSKCYFFHVKFEVRFVVSFTRKSMLNKKWHFSWAMNGPPFFYYHGGVWSCHYFFREPLQSMDTWLACQTLAPSQTTHSKTSFISKLPMVLFLFTKAWYKYGKYKDVGESICGRIDV